MPLFGKFSTKKTPPRKTSLSEANKDIEKEYNFLEDDNVIRLCLGDNETIFEDGQWVSETGSDGQTHKVNQKLRKQVQSLKEENNLLKLKFELLLDMFTESTTENQNTGRFKKKLK